MIGWISGIVLDKKPPKCVINVNGIGYEIETSMQTFCQLPEIKQSIQLYIHQAIREDAHLLFGFITEKERDVFRTLIKVNGVGPKMALGLLSGLSVDELVQCVQTGDTQRLTRLPGVGKKTAERLLIELRDRLSHWNSSDIELNAHSTTNTSSNANDAIDALLALGYKSSDAEKAIKKIAKPEHSTETLIKIALQNMLY